MKRKIPKRILNKALPVIESIANSRKVRAAFAHFTPEDIYQEIWKMCLDALSRWDTKKAKIDGPKKIEHYLNVHVSNRLKNLRRDHYYNIKDLPGLVTTRINLINAIPFSSMDESAISLRDRTFDNLLASDLYDYILERLDESLVDHFILLVNNNKVPNDIKEKIREEVRIILINRDDYD